MSGVAVETDIDEVHRLTADEYHQIIESGGFDEDARVELIDGLVLDMSPKTPAHERVIRLALGPIHRRGRDSTVTRSGVGAPLSLGNSEPEPDLVVIRPRTSTTRITRRPRSSSSRWPYPRAAATCA